MRRVCEETNLGTPILKTNHTCSQEVPCSEEFELSILGHDVQLWNRVVGVGTFEGHLKTGSQF